MNIKQTMAYHATQYRRLKRMLVSDAGELEEVKRAERAGHGQLNELKEYYRYVKNAEHEMDGIVKWLQDLATKAQNPEARKLAREYFARLQKNYSFVKKNRG